MALYDYKNHTIDELIEILQEYKKEMGGDTKVFLSDFEYNYKQKMFEVCKVEDENELFIFYEMHEGLWE